VTAFDGYLTVFIFSNFEFEENRRICPAGANSKFEYFLTVKISNLF
jgi:hypothetical protein